MRFAHIADTHIRNLKYHFEYREIFKQLYKSLKEENVDYIIHCGDIAHTKTQLSPEFVDLARDFFENLAAIAPTYMILGNHDGNLRNDSRQDAISPIVKAINSPNLVLLKNAGETKIDDQFCLNVLSVFDEENWTPPTNKEAVNIALYHGAIDKSKTDQNWTLGGDHSIEVFDEFDFAFLGDIHKTQQLDKEGRIWYAGSTVQQNFGETLDKGYLLWDIEDKDNFVNKPITFNNPKPFVTITLTEKGNLPRTTPPTGARLRIVSKDNISLEKVRKAVDIAKYKYNPETVTYLNRAAGKQIIVPSADGIEKKDLRNIKTQEALIADYLEEFSASEEVMKRVYELNKKYNTQIEEVEDVMRNVHWSLQTLEWDNLFNYGEGNSIDFTNLGGIVGIFGKNYSGKSSIVDSLLYSLYNTTSKSVRKNLNIINQNKESCSARVTIKVHDEKYVIERSSTKYTKRLKGEETQEASTDLEFYKQDMIGNQTSLNGTSRQDTDKNVRKYFGTHSDFLMTSMSSQLESLAFINEGSTKRKEFLAKFLDLELFDKKFKLAKEESATTKVALKRLEHIDFDSEIKNIKSDIMKSGFSIEKNKAICSTMKETTSLLTEELGQVQEKIESVPAEIIDPVMTTKEIENKKSSILSLTSKKTESIKALESDEKVFKKISDFLDEFDISSFEKKKQIIDFKKDQLASFLKEIRKSGDEIVAGRRKQDLLSEVPCGSQYPTCKFINDAHAAVELIQITEARQKDLTLNVNRLGAEIADLSPVTVESHIENYNLLVGKKNTLATSIVSNRLNIERADSLLFKEQIELERLQKKSEEYETNKESIENLKDLLRKQEALDKQIKKSEKDVASCENRIMNLHKKHGSLEQKLIHMEEQHKEYESLKEDFAAYHLLMTCCHPSGVSYNIIKERLPFINHEIAKILTNVVDFEIFISNSDDKLDIFIKHPEYGPRPLEMGSGAEKTIASMAIRLAFLTVSSLPKSDLFILDEPGTALDEENMEGFVQILDMIKGHFKTVILISHLDNLKDCVDMQINIEKKSGFAYVNL
jgi:DNA repair exonuclease SbcCD ATPase subunit/DNA repair exonuclease SbcCD nuclease subunit